MSQTWRLVAKAVLVLACLIYLGYNLSALGPGEVFAAAKQCHPGWLLLSLLPLAARFWLWSYKWAKMVSRQFPLGFQLSQRLVMAAAFINLVTPTAKLGGAFYRAIFLKQRLAFRASNAYGWVFADQMAHLSGNLLLLGLLTIVAPNFMPAMGGSLPYWGTSAFCFCVIGLFIASRERLWRKAQTAKVPEVLSRWLSAKMAALRGPGSQDSVKHFLQPWLASGKMSQFLSVEMGMSALSFAMLGLANAWVLRSLGAEFSLLPVMLVVLLAYLGGSVLGIMGGIGVTEVFLLKAYPLVGLTHTEAAAGALLHRALFYLFVLGVGGWSFGVLRKKKPAESVNVAQ